MDAPPDDLDAHSVFARDHRRWVVLRRCAYAGLTIALVTTVFDMATDNDRHELDDMVTTTITLLVIIAGFAYLAASNAAGKFLALLESWARPPEDDPAQVRAPGGHRPGPGGRTGR